MEKTVITAGSNFTDIDALASVLAYKEILDLLGTPCTAVFRGPTNHSVTPTIKKWGYDFNENIPLTPFKAIVLDVSEPEYIDSFVQPEKVIMIIDHHYGYETYWNDLLGDYAQIESIGACATQVWEIFVDKKLQNQISTMNANLLYTAIISNTLNFHAGVTTDRDIKAAKQLQEHISLPDNWIEQYFKEQTQCVLENIEHALTNDTKVQFIESLNTKLVIGQMELWNSYDFVNSNLSLISRTLSGFNLPLWFLTSPSISEGINYLYSESGEVKALLEKAIDAKFNGDMGATNKLWLRKEIVRELQQL